MSPVSKQLLRFAPFEVDLAARLLRREGALVPLSPKAFDLLAVLLEHRGAVVDKTTLMERLWPDTFVEEGNLPVTVFALRKALGEPADQFIRTVPRRGYCFTAPVTVVEESPTLAASRTDAGDVALAASPGGSEAPAARAAGSRPLAWAALAVAAAVVVAAVAGWRSWPAADGLAQVQSLAVLPFSATGMDARESDAMGTGFAASIASSLVGLDELIVRPFTSGAKFGGPVQNAVDAGQALRVDAVLTGTLRFLGPNVQVSSALVRVSDGARLWSDSSTAPVETLGRVELELVERLTLALEPGGPPDDTARLHRQPPERVAYDAYLRGRAAAGTWTLREVERAAALYADSVARDPGFAGAHAGLAAMLVLPPTTMLSSDTLARAKASAGRALALDPSLSEAHSAWGRAALISDFDWAGAERAFRAGITAAPYDAEPHVWYAHWLSAQGRHEEALAEIRLAQDVDPTSPRVNLYVGTLLLAARRFDEGVAQLRKTPIEMGVVNQQVYLATAVGQAKQRRWDEAFAMVERMVRSAPNGPARAYRAYLLAEAGRGAEADTLLDELAREADSRRTPHIVLAAAYACRGRMDEAFTHLDTAYDERDPRVLFLAVDPMLDCVRHDGRYSSAARRIGLEP